MKQPCRGTDERGVSELLVRYISNKEQTGKWPHWYFILTFILILLSLLQYFWFSLKKQEVSRLCSIKTNEILQP